ncbi:hypothetical protein MJO28_002973 [Puccinia striiformis f. sp. tritici]|uniref:Secreted protein n=3 Tax=Puccinia striiformis TaxID=27350 RepID=A0A0L0VAH6_9BASI|nr:hypothetical protein Pst134EA_005089 [Puccinia striiformis f. sp. tritici]KAI9619993.1 hypothetical protein H4Q26_013975 [Puccinia striiformis f. sp. tritici PST-130]KNE96282.1 hypothetical protein PSTG_10402 [Puccinia striiformis f. sp. tritici PST-78]POW09846.1 hypothetical protein PSTT_06504 [Puccinia striiformis]KAH9462241.1 hypothetical protein Pst134EB_006148 [Puccinia striiformis f. sp. tritici]KAH9471181.1 hypothetical protein Pst134EA_005089 [Puccinia striiformis f. sp. tritici]
MRAFSLIFILGIVLSTQALNSSRRLIPRCTDDTKELVKGEVTVTQVSASCLQASESIKVSCSDNNSVKLQESVSSVQVYVTQLKTIVETFDGKHAMYHKTTVVGIFASYFSMIETISKTKDGKQVCQTQLVQINEAFLSISSVYIAMGIDLRHDFQDSSELNEDAFKQLDLAPPFAEKDGAPDEIEEKDD